MASEPEPFYFDVATTGGRPKTVRVAGERFLIGRDPDCDLVLNDERAARQHAVLEPLPHGHVLLRDLGSAAGTYVDGERIANPVMLRGSEEIRIGRTTLTRTEPEEEREEPAAALEPGEPPVQPLPPDYFERKQEPVRQARRTAAIVVVAALLLAIAAGALFATGVFRDDGPRSTAEVVNELARSTVLVFAADRRRDLEASGTGWVLDASEGLIVTTGHAVQGDDDFAVSLEGSERQTAALVGVAPCADLAVLKVRDTGGLEEVALASRDSVEEGEAVVAVGFPSGSGERRKLAATTGAVSVARATVEGGLHSPRQANAVRTDLAIDPGTSGGPLVDLDARLVGVIVSHEEGGERESYAIGVDRVREVTDVLRTGSSLGWTGAWFVWPEQDLSGLLVSDVVPETSAARAFARLPVLLTAIGGARIDNRLPTYCRAVGARREGASARFTVFEYRTGRTRNVRVRFE